MFCDNSFVSWPWVIMACTLNIKFLEYKLVLTWKISTDCNQVLIGKKNVLYFNFYESPKLVILES